MQRVRVTEIDVPGSPPEPVWLLDDDEEPAVLANREVTEDQPPKTKWMRTGDGTSLRTLLDHLDEGTHPRFRFPENTPNALRADFKAAVTRLYTTPAGRRLINAFSTAGRPLNIFEEARVQGSQTPTYVAAPQSADRPGQPFGTLAIPPRASDTTRRYGEPSTDDRGVSTPIPAPLFISIGHELIHALRTLRGIGIPIPPELPPGTELAGEEAPTIGLAFTQSEGLARGIGDIGPPVNITYDAPIPTENLLRAEHGLPLRHFLPVQPEPAQPLPRGFKLATPAARDRENPPSNNDK